MLSLLQAVLDAAHKGHHYVTDQQRWGVPEDWRAELIGDCDSFALWCREQLIAAGEPAPLLAVCRIAGQGLHLVCMTHDGLVLDNRQTRVCHMRDLPYEWISAGPFEDGAWRGLS